MQIFLKSTVAAAALMGALFATPSALGQTPSLNSGSLGSAGNGTHSAGVTLNLPGAVSAGGDLAVGYSNGANTLVPFNPALNPASSSPFTIEFWAKPGELTNNSVGPSPLFNRTFDANRTGWVFFQRAEDTGWEFRMFTGVGTTVGYELVGGTNSTTSWSHVVAVWNGTNPFLYVDGQLVDDTATGSQSYKANEGIGGTPSLSIGAYQNGDNPFSGSVDEVAFYPTALSPAQILAHYNTASSPVAGAYSSLVLADGAVEYLQNVPEPTAASLLLIGLVGCGGLKRHRRPRV